MIRTLAHVLGFDVADRLQYATTTRTPEEGEPNVGPPPGYRRSGPWVYIESLGERHTRWVCPLIEDLEALERAEKDAARAALLTRARDYARELVAAHRRGEDIACRDERDRHILQAVSQGTRDVVVIAAWGAHPLAREEWRTLPDIALRCLGTTKSGAPKHPLYLPATATLEAWPKEPK